MRQNLFHAGHAHAGVLPVLSLVALRYVDEAQLSDGWKQLRALLHSLSSHLFAAAFFFSVLSPHATAPNGFIYLAYIGAMVLAIGLLALGVGLLKANPWLGKVAEYRRTLGTWSWLRSRCVKSVGIKRV